MSLGWMVRLSGRNHLHTLSFIHICGRNVVCSSVQQQLWMASISGHFHCEALILKLRCEVTYFKDSSDFIFPTQMRSDQSQHSWSWRLPSDSNIPVQIKQLKDFCSIQPGILYLPTTAYHRLISSGSWSCLAKFDKKYKLHMTINNLKQNTFKLRT
jgi:hypothetical protein